MNGKFTFNSIFNNVKNNKDLIKKYKKGYDINLLAKIYYKNHLNN